MHIHIRLLIEPFATNIALVLSLFMYPFVFVQTAGQRKSTRANFAFQRSFSGVSPQMEKKYFRVFISKINELWKKHTYNECMCL